jgi:hypothetical protein
VPLGELFGVAAVQVVLDDGAEVGRELLDFFE